MKMYSSRALAWQVEVIDPNPVGPIGEKRYGEADVLPPLLDADMVRGIEKVFAHFFWL
jgi:hypothetical protein